MLARAIISIVTPSNRSIMNRFPFFILILVMLAGSLAGSLTAQGQDCNTYLKLKKGSEYEILTFDSKNKKTGRVVHEVVESKPSAGKTEATVRNKVYDKNDKLSSQGDYQFVCQNGTVMIDMKSLISADMLKAYEDMEMKASGDFLELPSDISVGQQLKDASYVIDVFDKKSGRAMSSIRVFVTNRKVEGKEQITCPAGTFDTFEVSQDMKMETVTMGIAIPINMQSIDWYAAGLGAIRSESHRKGKLMGYSLLNKSM
jgi:hypothetical protein